MSADYDSRPDTLEHISQVRAKMEAVTERLEVRAQVHDRSKLLTPEVECFDEFTPKLKATTYGSDEYEQFLADMQVGLAHHYAANSHHPEHFVTGIEGMSLLDLIEMLCDWKAATERHADGDMGRSLVINAERFGISPQLAQILANTVEEMEWLPVLPPTGREGGQ